MPESEVRESESESVSAHLKPRQSGRASIPSFV